MLKFLLHRVVTRMERRYDYDATYLHELVDTSTAAAMRYFTAQSYGRWQGPVPRDAWHAAAIGAALVEDCGPCVQIASDRAVEAGMPGTTIKALLSGEPADADAKLGFDFARALLTASDALDGLREAVEARWGRKGIVALATMAMYSRNFPVLKRALGHARSCRRIRIAGVDVAVAAEIEAA